MSVNNRRKYVKHLDVIRYWEPKLIELEKVLDLGELEAEFDPVTNHGICFACGWRRKLERAHIQARVDGGSDEVSNIHLLCRICHQSSEYIDDLNGYWNWFSSTNQMTSALGLVLLRNPFHVRTLLTRY